jgi:hypothetical protein
MRRLVVALVLAALVAGLTACSGGGESGTTSSTGSNAAAPAAAAPPPPGGGAAPEVASGGTNTLSPREESTGTAFPTDGPMVPRLVSSRVKAKQPMLVLFYDPDQLSTKDERREINAAMKGYRGLIDIVELDTTSALPDPVTGAVNKDSLAQQTALLAQNLKVGFTPYLVFVDRNGVITGRYRGYVDRGLIEREIIRATQ